MQKVLPIDFCFQSEYTIAIYISQTQLFKNCTLFVFFFTLHSVFIRIPYDGSLFGNYSILRHGLYYEECASLQPYIRFWSVFELRAGMIFMWLFACERLLMVRVFIPKRRAFSRRCRPLRGEQMWMTKFVFPFHIVPYASYFGGYPTCRSSSFMAVQFL